MDDASCWNCIQISTPAITTRSFAREQVEALCRSGGHHHLEEWLVDLYTTLGQLARELNQQDITHLMALESSFLHQIVQQKVDMRSEKFFPKMKQASRAARRWLQFFTPKLVDDVSQLMKTPKTGTANKLQEYRLASPAVLRHLLCHLARGHGTLRQTVIYCEEAGVWLQCKMSIGQRSGLALSLYSVVARLRALSLYLMQSMSTGFEKLSVLLFGMPLSATAAAGDGGAQMVLDGLPKHLRDGGEKEEEETPLGKEKRKADIKSLLGDLYNEKAAGVPSARATQPLGSDGPSADEGGGYEETAPPLPSASQLDDDDLGEVINRSSIPSTKKRKRDTSNEELSTKRRKGNKVLVKKKKKQMDASNGDNCVVLATTHSPIKKKKKKLDNEGFNVLKSPSQMANSSIDTPSVDKEDSGIVPCKKKLKKVKKLSGTRDLAECSGVRRVESFSEKLNTICRKFNSKSALHSRVEMDPSREECKENATVLKKSNSFLKTCNSLLHIPQSMAKKTDSVTNLKNPKNKVKKIKKRNSVPVD